MLQKKHFWKVVYKVQALKQQQPPLKREKEVKKCVYILDVN